MTAKDTASLRSWAEVHAPHGMIQARQVLELLDEIESAHNWLDELGENPDRSANSLRLRVESLVKRVDELEGYDLRMEDNDE